MILNESNLWHETQNSIFQLFFENIYIDGYISSTIINIYIYKSKYRPLDRDPTVNN